MTADLHDLIFGSAVVGYVVGGILVILGIATLVGLVVRDDGDRLTPGVADPPRPRRSPFAAPQSANDVVAATRRAAAALPTTATSGGESRRG